jgi:hypothetical protein
LLSTIIRQYSRSPAEEVTLKIQTALSQCKLAFRSADATTIELCFGLYESMLFTTEMHNEVFTQATEAVRNHPQLASTNRLHICHSPSSGHVSAVPHIANEVGLLFGSVGSLNELTICHCYLRPYLISLLNPEDGYATEPVAFPPIKKLTISHPHSPNDKDRTAIVRLVTSQHALGIPFECLVIRGRGVFAGIEEELGPWVGSVEYYDESR